MDDFRKPRPDYPLLPETALYRPKTKGLKRIKGRRGIKPKKGRAIPKPFKGYQDPMFRDIKARDEKRKARELAIEKLKAEKATEEENLRQRRERLRLEDRSQQDTRRYRAEQLALEYQRDATTQAIEDRRQRDVQDLFRHFQGLYSDQERRSGDLQKSFADQIIRLHDRGGGEVSEIGGQLQDLIKILTPREARRTQLRRGEGGGGTVRAEPLLEEEEEEEPEPEGQPFGIGVEAERERERTGVKTAAEFAAELAAVSPKKLTLEPTDPESPPSVAEQRFTASRSFSGTIEAVKKASPKAKPTTPMFGETTPQRLAKLEKAAAKAEKITTPEFRKARTSLEQALARQPIAEPEPETEPWYRGLSQEEVEAHPRFQETPTEREAEELSEILVGTPVGTGAVEGLNPYEQLLELRGAGTKKFRLSQQKKGKARTWKDPEERFDFTMEGKVYNIMGITAGDKDIQYRDPEVGGEDLDEGWHTMNYEKFHRAEQEGEIEVLKPEGGEEV